MEIAEKESPRVDNQCEIETSDGMLAIGDSLMIAITSSLQEIYPIITIDAKIERCYDIRWRHY